MNTSLAVTLQVIGRSARTGQANIGGATFLAEPAGSGSEIAELYETGAVWRTSSTPTFIQALSTRALNSS